jgi:hypothetical protein
LVFIQSFLTVFPAPATTISAAMLKTASGSAGGMVNGVNGNIVGVDPLLGPLQNSGGPTFTASLPSGSRAINAGATDPQITSDQREIARPQGIGPDIGAFEVQGTAPVITSANVATLPSSVSSRRFLRRARSRTMGKR